MFGERDLCRLLLRHVWELLDAARACLEPRVRLGQRGLALLHLFWIRGLTFMKSFTHGLAAACRLPQHSLE